MKKLGLIINPIAGMGGRVGLKGTDGREAYQKALSLGAAPQAHKRAFETLSIIASALRDVTLITPRGSMGEDTARRCGLSPVLIDGAPQDCSRYSAADTRKAALEMRKLGVDLLLFAGGDGTARDICNALNSRASSPAHIPALGIPAGVKMHSGVFALTPRRAGEIALKFLLDDFAEVAYAEVMDIDEDAFRQGRVSATLYGFMKAPYDSHGIQATKAGTTGQLNEEPLPIARQVISDMTDGTLYIIGPGTTTAAISEALGIDNSLLGVDAVLNKELLCKDATEDELIRLTENIPAKVVVSVIGGQGYIIGRGNQQISPELIRQVGVDNLIVVATRRKLLELNGRPLLVDTGDPKLDGDLSGYTKVITGFRESHIYRISC